MKYFTYQYIRTPIASLTPIHQKVNIEKPVGALLLCHSGGTLSVVEGDR